MSGNPNLRVEKLSKTYSSGDEALDEVSFAVDGAEVIAVIGPSGAGKSTLIECINRLTEPTSGSIYIDGTDIVKLDTEELREIRKDIGMIFQEYNLVERLTVMENVLSGRLGYVSFWNAFRRSFGDENVTNAAENLERVGLLEYENNRVDELSGGQRQRVGIARAVTQHPKLLLADEPTSSLDPESSHTVMNLLTRIATEDDIPVLINIHEVELALEYADRVIGLHDGSIVFDGQPGAVDAEIKDRIYQGPSAPAAPQTD